MFSRVLLLQRAARSAVTTVRRTIGATGTASPSAFKRPPTLESIVQDWSSSVTRSVYHDEDTLGLKQVRRIDATLAPFGHVVWAPRAVGQPANLGVHWFLFNPIGEETSEDGHDALFAPPRPFTRRMWASGRMWFRDSPIRIGAQLALSSRVGQVELKQTRTAGPVLFVTRVHRVSTADASTPGTVLVDEEQVLAYMTTPFSTAPPRSDATRAPEWLTQALASGSTSTTGLRVLVRPSELSLFRFSALTYNCHRIHYDQRYATQAEMYPDLLVHAPLAATYLLRIAEQYAHGTSTASATSTVVRAMRRFASEGKADGTALRFEYKALRPWFVNTSANVVVRDAGERLHLGIVSGRDADVIMLGSISVENAQQRTCE